MMGRRYKSQNTAELIAFDLVAPILPGIGAGGITFNHTFPDFEYTLMHHQFEVDDNTRIKHSYNDDLFYFTVQNLEEDFALYIDVFSGKITSMFCKKAYKGQLNGFGIGSSIRDFLAADKNLYFDLDHSFFVRSPFDGLVIYAPERLSDAIWNAECNGEPIPDFAIEGIEILEMNFARIMYEDTLFYKSE